MHMSKDSQLGNVKKSAIGRVRLAAHHEWKAPRMAMM